MTNERRLMLTSVQEGDGIPTFVIPYTTSSMTVTNANKEYYDSLNSLMEYLRSFQDDLLHPAPFLVLGVYQQTSTDYHYYVLSPISLDTDLLDKGYVRFTANGRTYDKSNNQWSIY